MSSPAAEPSSRDPHQVADMLDILAVADTEVATVLNGVSSSRSPVSRATISALERLLATLRPATDVRARLVGVDRRVLAAAVEVRRERRDRIRLAAGEAQ